LEIPAFSLRRFGAEFPVFDRDRIGLGIVHRTSEATKLAEVGGVEVASIDPV
jgi:hypothetical protein